MKRHYFLLILFALCSIGAKADGLDTSNMKVTAIASDRATSIDTDKWYLMVEHRDGLKPVQDNGANETITRASSEDVVTAWSDDVIGSYGADVANYLVHFVETGTTSTNLERSTVYNVQFATGNYFTATDPVKSTASADDAGKWNVYTIQVDGEDQEGYFGFNVYDMGSRLDNNGAGGNLVLWDTGEIDYIEGQDNNNHWSIYEVTLEEMTDEDKEAIAQIELNNSLLSLIRDADALYETYNSWTKTTGDGLITASSQLSSPYTSTSEGKDLGNLIDRDSSTYWHSEYGDAPSEDDIHYFQVNLNEDLGGCDLIAYIQRRSDANNDHITKMAVKDEDDNVIAILDYPFTEKGEELEDHFYCPAGVTTLRFYEEESSTSSDHFFHLAEFQLYEAEISDDCANATHPKTASTFAKAIKAASELYASAMTGAKEGTITDDDIEALTEAIAVYTAAIAEDEVVVEPNTVHSCEAELGEYSAEDDRYLPAHWTIDNNTTAANFHVNTWSTEADASGMVTPFCEYWVYGTTLSSGTISHTELSELDNGYYYVSVDARIFAESEDETIGTGTTFNVNTESEDLVTYGTEGTYGTEKEEYGTYQVVAEVTDGTLSISFTIPEGVTYNWLAWKNLNVIYLGDTYMGYVTGTMNTDVEQAMKDAVDAYNNDNTDENLQAAAEAIAAALASVEFYTSVAEQLEALNLDEAGTAAWEETESAAKYAACTLTPEDDLTADIATAQKAQTTAGSDMTYVVLYDGYWTAVQGNGPTGLTDGSTETYNSTNYETGKVLYYTVEGLQPGTYEVTFYAVANSCWLDDKINGSGIAQVYVNDVTEDATVYDQGSCTPSDYSYTITATVGADGVLEFGLQNIATGGNWYVGQAISLTLESLTDAIIGDATPSTHAIAKGTTVTITFDCYTSKDYTLSGDESKFSFDNGSEDATVEYTGDGVFTLTVTDDLEVGKEYTLTISEGALAYEDTSVESTEQTIVFVAQGITEDQKGVYLLNVADNEFLSRGNDYGTEADLDPYGVPVDITIGDDGYATVMFLDSQDYLYGDYWAYTNAVDAGSTASNYIFIQVDEDNDYGTVYQLKGGSTAVTDGLLYVNHTESGLKLANNGDGTNYTDAEQTYWVIVDVATRNEIKAAWLQDQKDEIAAALCVEDLDAYAEAATSTDCTSQLSETYSDGTELFETASSLTETVTDLTPGLYKVTVQGFHRMGSNAHCWELGETYEDLDLSVAYLKANDDQINLKPWYAAATRTEVATDYYTYVPDDMAGAGNACDNGDYTNTVYTIVEADDQATTGSLTITIGCPSTISANWMFVKNLTLTLLDAPNLFMNEDPENPGTYYGTFSDATTDRSLVDGVTASYLLAGGVDPEGTDEGEEWGTLTFTDVDGIAAGEGYLCMYTGEAGNGTMEFSLPAATTDVTAPEGNLLKAVSTETSGAELGDYAYVLSAVDDVVGFYKLDSSATIAAGKAYADLSSVLEASDDDNDVKLFKIVFGTSTGIETITPVSVSTDAIYDLAGRKVSKPVKGSVYISGGKKVLY